MNDIDLTPRLIASHAPRTRVPGRYSASEIWWIINGRTSPEQYLYGTEKDIPDMFKMWDGTMIHHGVQSILRRNYKEEKREFPGDFGITIVGMADYLPNEGDGCPKENEVWEFKSSDKKMSMAKPWHIHQVRMYCSMFGKDIGKVFQPIRTPEKIYLKHIAQVSRDDAWFMTQMEQLLEFEQRVQAVRSGNNTMAI